MKIFFKENDEEMSDKVVNPHNFFLYKAKSNCLLEVCISSQAFQKNFFIQIETYDGKSFQIHYPVCFMYIILFNLNLLAIFYIDCFYYIF